jgi:hypothetical protein
MILKQIAGFPLLHPFPLTLLTVSYNFIVRLLIALSFPSSPSALINLVYIQAFISLILHDLGLAASIHSTKAFQNSVSNPGYLLGEPNSALSSQSLFLSSNHPPSTLGIRAN